MNYEFELLLKILKFDIIFLNMKINIEKIIVNYKLIYCKSIKIGGSK